MKVKEIKIREIKDCPFNPRVKLLKTDTEYQKIKNSLETYGVVEPLVVNEYNWHCVGGNQRLNVLRDMGVSSVPCVLINEEDLMQEKAMCIALNKVKGEWDEDKLTELLTETKISGYETGFILDDDDEDSPAFEIYSEDEEKELEAPLTGEEQDSEMPTEDDEEEPNMDVAFIKVGDFGFKVPAEEYQECLTKIRKAGYFSRNEIVEEFKRRLLNG